MALPNFIKKVQNKSSTLACTFFCLCVIMKNQMTGQYYLYFLWYIGQKFTDNILNGHNSQGESYHGSF